MLQQIKQRRLGMIEKIASKTFASQFIQHEKDDSADTFQRLVLAVKNNRCDLLACIPSSLQQLKAKDEADKNLLFYAVYEKCALAMLYLLRAGLPYQEFDREHKNLYHFMAYSGSVECLQTLNFYIKVTKLQKLNQSLLGMLSKYGYKRTDMKAGKLKYSVSPKREAQFNQLQKQATTLLQQYLQSYLNLLQSALFQKDQANQRNPIHLVCLNKYQKCLATLEELLHQFQNPDLSLTNKLMMDVNTTNGFFDEHLDPRLYEDTLQCLRQIPPAETTSKLLKNYDRQVRGKIKQLLETKDKDGQSPLYIASKNGSTAMINLLHKYAGVPNNEEKQEIMKVAENNLARSHIIDLCEASQLPDIKPLTFLISCGEQINGKKTIFGTFALIESLKSFKECNSLEPIKALISSGADVNIQDTNGWTVLHHAASLGLKQIVQFLLKSAKQTNLQINKVTNKRYHALHLAGMNQHPEIIKLLIEDQSHNVNIDFADWDGCTALIHAAKKGSLKVLKTLLELKANLYAKDIHDMTALHHAAFSNHPQCIRQLLNYDSDYDKLRQMRSTKGKLAKDLCTDHRSFENIFTAARTGNVNLIRKLTSQNPSLKDSTTKEKERTPLILAVIAKSLASVKFLVDIGADTYHEDKNGKSALAYCQDHLKQSKASKKQDVKLVQQILKLLQ